MFGLAVPVWASLMLEGWSARQRELASLWGVHGLHEAEVLQGQGQTIAQVVKQLGITEQTFYRWRKEYGGMRVDQARRLKEVVEGKY